MSSIKVESETWLPACRIHENNDVCPPIVVAQMFGNLNFLFLYLLIVRILYV